MICTCEQILSDVDASGYRLFGTVSFARPMRSAWNQEQTETVSVVNN